MSEVVAMPGVSPAALARPTNADAIDVLERMLVDFKGGKYTSLAVVATGENDNWMRESATTTGHAIQLVGLSRVLQHSMEKKIANLSWGE